MSVKPSWVSAGAICSTLVFGVNSTFAQCQTEPRLQNFSGLNTVPCTCLLQGEQAGVVLDAPAGDYPIQIVRVGIGWYSQFGGAPDSQEQAIHTYGAGLPNPGAPIFSLLGPILTDGQINVFDLTGQNVILNNGPFTVTLEFLNTNSGNVFAPSVADDGNGCQLGKNVVFVIPGGWNDTCPLGVSGDWVFYIDYRTNLGCVKGDTNCDGGVDGKDIDGFVKALIDSNCSIPSADIDGNGAVQMADIGPFVQCLLNAACS